VADFIHILVETEISSKSYNSKSKLLLVVMNPHKENTVVTTILKWIFKKYDSGQTGFSWLRIGTSDRPL
jgi:hypothetical protein